MTSTARSAFPWLTVVAVMVATLSLRGPIVAPNPVLADIQRDLGIGPAQAGLLTTAPIVMFAALTPLAALVIRRTGAEVAVAVTLSGVLVGTFLRAIPGFGWMLAGMLVIGASITLGNIVMPVIIRRDVPPRHAALVTAVYASFLNAGSLVTTLGTAPLAGLVGWPLALLAWSLVTVVGLVVWGVHARRDRDPAATWAERDSGDGSAAPVDRAADDPSTLTGPLPVVLARRRGERSAWAVPVSWLLMLGFAAQSGAYYALTTWLPTIAHDELGLDRSGSGALASVFQGVAIVGALLIPLLGRIAPPAVPPLFVSACWLVLGAGMLVAPHLLGLWVVVGALAHSGGFVVIFTLLVRTAASDRQAAGMSAFVQGGGYVVAAVAPPVLGALHTASGGWTLPLACVFAATVAYGGFVLGAHVVARRR